jgi:hypothetical protein
MSARPGLKVVTTASEPGLSTCKLARCRRVIEEWKSSHTMM